MLILPLICMVLFIGFAFGIIMSMGYEVYITTYVPPIPPSNNTSDFDMKVDSWIDFYYKE